MESPLEAADPAARTYSQVVFTDTPQSYPPLTPVTCCYTLTAAFQPNPRDWVGIFKVGWSTIKDYHTFVWVEPCLDVVGKESAARQTVFKDYYLPKDDDFYQFCYVDSAGQVRGASTPFCFKKQAEKCTESSMDEDLLVITTQEQVELSLHEKAELQKELDQIKRENETLKNDLQMERQQAAGIKGQIEQKEKRMSQLVKEMDQIKEQYENLQSTFQEKEEMIKQTEKQQRDAVKEKKQSLSLDVASKQNETHAQEKYERALMKIKLLKEEREVLNGKIDAQSVEISMLNSRQREQERELFKMKDSIQLLQVDLQSSEKEKERLSEELHKSHSLAQDMGKVKEENQELCRSLSRQITLQNCPEDDLRVQCQTLGCQLQEAQGKLAAEREETKNARRHAESLDKELQRLKEMLEKVDYTREQAQLTCGKQELQLTESRETIAEAREVIADREGTIEEKERMITLVKQEKEELARENQMLTSDIERLRKAFADFQASPPADSTYMQPDNNSPGANTSANNDWQQQQQPPGDDNLYETIDTPADPEQESLVCRHCQECFPCITRHELEAHEQSHRVCPFCTMICDNMEQSVFEDHVYGHGL
ncbi:calcium-binding and coiled-coil domain-containing protein 2 isoform X2 [Anoplopoma fimbria]|uniref:calcium-binding and coiled-coil domain-containing protein 2 isoform X2 n=1 Tax=Anoplopoma fimbria TaxID=229290 RepID=UPI0023EDF3CD|nr:calcium-binding and coiled-coil domain-containing protein 2 isoform X2 [Anoplopoma fimbria]